MISEGSAALRLDAPTAGNLQPIYYVKAPGWSQRRRVRTQILCVHKRKCNGRRLAYVSMCSQALDIVRGPVGSFTENLNVRVIPGSGANPHRASTLRFHRMFRMCERDTRRSGAACACGRKYIFSVGVHVGLSYRYQCLLYIWRRRRHGN